MSIPRQWAFLIPIQSNSNRLFSLFCIFLCYPYCSECGYHFPFLFAISDKNAITFLGSLYIFLITVQLARVATVPPPDRSNFIKYWLQSISPKCPPNVASNLPLLVMDTPNLSTCGHKTRLLFIITFGA